MVPSRLAAGFARLRDRVSFAGVIAGVALFIALGGTAAAVTALPRDTVGSPQIRKDAVRSPEIAKDAVRSPEIAKDAVRSPEIAKDAVRSSEIRDNGILLADISNSARNALHGAQGPAGPQGPAGVTEARIAQGDQPDVPHCSDQRLIDCPNLLTRTLGAGNWLVQAKLDVVNLGGQPVPLDSCGLAQGSAVLDSASVHLDRFVDSADIESLALTAVVADAANGTTVALRCTEQTGEDLTVQHMKIAALRVTTVTGP